MKTLIFNGCSFMAGDELVWEQYHHHYGRPVTKWSTTGGDVVSASDTEFRFGYLKYRQSFNLPSVICTMLGGYSKIDLAQDGKSNENIAIETIACLNRFSKDERENFHVIIGWTCPSRILKYSKISSRFVDLNAGHYDKHTIDPAKNALRSHVKTRILDGDDEDFILDYVKNIMLLENYLIANNISYTFYRALDEGICNFEKIGPFDSDYIHQLTIKDCTNHKNWYKFTNDTQTPINDLSWNTEFSDKTHYWVNLTNCHPGKEIVNIFAARLVEYIKNQQVL